MSLATQWQARLSAEADGYARLALENITREYPALVSALMTGPGQFPHRPRDVSEALAISPDVPVIPCDARNRESTKATLVTLVEHAMSMQTAGRF